MKVNNASNSKKAEGGLYIKSMNYIEDCEKFSIIVADDDVFNVFFFH